MPPDQFCRTGDGGEAAHDHVITYDNMASRRQFMDAAITQHSHARYAHSHKQIVVADTGQTIILYGTSMYCASFTNNVVITDLQTGRLTLIFFILTVFPHRGELKYCIVTTNGRWALNDNMGVNLRSSPDFNIGTNNGEGSYLYIIGQPR